MGGIFGKFFKKAKKEISIHGAERLVKRAIKDLKAEVLERIEEFDITDLLNLSVQISSQIARLKPRE